MAALAVRCLVCLLALSGSPAALCLPSCNCSRSSPRPELLCVLTPRFGASDSACLTEEIAPQLLAGNLTALRLRCGGGGDTTVLLDDASFDNAAVAGLESLWIDATDCGAFGLLPQSAPFRRMRRLRRLVQTSYSGRYSFSARNFLGLHALQRLLVYFSPQLRLAADFLAHLPSLQLLALSGGDYKAAFFDDVANCSALASLRALALQKNDIDAWPRVLRHAVNVRRLYLDGNRLSWAGNRLPAGWLPRLQFLSLGHRDFGPNSVQQRSCRFFSAFPRLEQLELSNYKAQADCSWFDSAPRLQAVSCLRCRFINPSPQVFAGLGGLRRLWLIDARHHCEQVKHVRRLGGWGPRARQWRDWSGLRDFFGLLTNLTELQLNGSRFAQPDPKLALRQALPPEFFGPSLRRLRALSLKACGLEVIRDADFRHLTALRELDASDNAIVTPQFLLPLLDRSLESVAIEVECACGIRALRQRALRLPSERIRCRNLPVRLRHFSASWLDCDGGWQVLMLSVTAGTLALACGGCAALYKYRFDLQYWCLTRRNRSLLGHRLYKRAPAATAGCKQFTAFVSYNHGNADFVYDELVPQLENDPDWQIRLCIDDRDFLAGSFIIENVWQAVDLSRFTIFLVDAAFVRSNWCQYELRTAEHLFLEKLQAKVILVFLDGSESLPDLPGVIRRLKKFVTYLTYSEQMNPRARGLFWKRLKLALAKGDD